MSRPVQAFVLVMLGGVLIRLVLTREYLDYVRPGLGWMLATAGVLIAALGIVGLVRDLRNVTEGDQAAAQLREERRRRTHGPGAVATVTETEHQHDDWYGHGVAWLVCAPLFLLLLLPPPALGSYAAGRASAAVPEGPAHPSFPALAASDPVELPIRDYDERAVWDQGRTLTGRRIVLVGFVDPTLGEHWYLTRLHVICCAADATSAKVQVVGSSVRPPTGQWTTVTGVWLPSDPDDLDGRVARIQAEQVVATSRPANSYE